MEGDGFFIKDEHGKTYLDATSGGVWTVNAGYGRKRIAEAVRDQLEKMCFFGQTAGNLPARELAERLTEKTEGLTRVIYSTSGSEANEKAYKLVRQLANREGGNKRFKIVYRDRDYHGTTITALSSTGQPQRRAQYGPETPGFVEMPHCLCYRCPFGKRYGSCNIECARSLETILEREGPETVGAVVLEPVTAGGGVIVPPPEYFPIIEEICRRYGVMLHIDEVVCGMGRTGRWFGYQHYGVRPDLVTLAKGVASGYAPIACTLSTEAVFERVQEGPDDPLNYFRDISTFGGCTAGPAAALENLKILEEEALLENATVMGERLLDGLKELQEKYPIVGEVRGLGLLLGVELVRDRETREPVAEGWTVGVAGHCMRNGLIVGRTNRSFPELNNTLALCPALTIDGEGVNLILERLEAALAWANGSLKET